MSDVDSEHNATGGTGDAAVRLEAVSKTYPGPPRVEALRKIDLVIGHGELVGIVGSSGSGKSTLLNIVGTLDRPTEGRVLIDGQDTHGRSDSALTAIRATRVGFVFQQFHLLERASAAANVANGLVYRGVARKERHRRAVAALEQVGLGGRAEQRVAQLSGGERQRVAIARAIVSDPAIVLADEPTGNLDSVNSAAIMDLLGALNDQGTTIVVITHDRELARALPRTITISDGELVNDSAPRFETAGAT